MSDTDEGEMNTDGDIAFARTTEEMKGHLTVSVQYAKAGNTKMAAHHAGHPHEEYWSAINATLSETNATLAAELETALRNAPDHARNDTASEYAAYINDTLFPLLDAAKRSVVGDHVTNSTFNARVSRDLLQRTVQEYNEGVTPNGTIANQMEYDDARGFALRAEALYQNHVRATLSEHAQEELDELFENFQSNVADSKPPEAMQSVTTSIAAEYSEYTAIKAETGETQVNQTISEIEEHLHEAVEAYENGNPTKAKQIIRQTYLSYFEGLEGELIEKRPELVEELEADFNEDLPGLIEQNASVSKVHGEVESMEKKLDTVEQELADENETSISLGDEDTTTAETTENPTEAAESTTIRTTENAETTSSVPGFGVGAALIALTAAALIALRRVN